MPLQIVAFPLIRVIGWIGEEALDTTLPPHMLHHAMFPTELLGLKHPDDLAAQFQLDVVRHLQLPYRKTLARLPHPLRE